MIICFSGSREMNMHQFEYIERCLNRVQQQGHSVLVGDAQGVDEAVMEGCAEREIPVTCYHLHSEPRYGYRQRFPKARFVSVQVQANRHTWYAYSLRDERMVDQADFVMCIWNGRSTGTARVYDYAKRQGKRCSIMTFRS